MLKKWLKTGFVAFFGAIFILSSAYVVADPSDINIETLLNRVYNDDVTAIAGCKQGTQVTHRTAVGSADAGDPTIGSGENLSGWKKAIVVVSVDSTVGDVGWELTPLFGNSTTSKYAAGTTRTVSDDSIFTVDVRGEDDFYIKMEGAVGADPTATILLIPSNE